MKFKYLAVAFTILLVFIISVLVILPSFISDPSLSQNLQKMTLPIILLSAAVVVFACVFFIFNYRLLSLLEREDWPAIAYYLEQKLFVKGRYSNQKVKLLASSYMVISDYPSVLKLESKTSLAKPALVDKNVLVFGSARIFAGNYSEAAAFFKAHLDKNKLKQKDADWVHCFYGFANLLNSSFPQAEIEFASLANSSNDALVTGLSSYFLNSSLAKHSASKTDCIAAAENGQARILKTLKNKKSWQKEVNKMSGNVHIAIIRKYIDEAGNWLFAEKETI